MEGGIARSVSIKCVVQCNAAECNAVKGNAKQYHVVRFSAVQHCTKLDAAMDEMLVDAGHRDH